MLVLQRRKNESVIIQTANGDIRVAYLGIDRGEASIAIDAPKQVGIMRNEIAGKFGSPQRLSQVERLCGVLEVSNMEQAIKKCKALMGVGNE